MVTATEDASVFVTKISAAERQLRAAIRMFFQEEDDLAIHTVTSAAYQIIKDLKSHRGRSEVGDHFYTSLFYVVRSYRRGDLPKSISEDQEAMNWIRRVAVTIPITADSRFLDATTSVPKSMEAKYWNDRNAIPNFLKHADRDPAGYISANEIDNLELLTSVVSAYIDLVPENPPPEFLPLVSYARARNDIDPSERGDIADLARDIRDKPEQLRRKFTWVFLQQYIASAEH